MGIPVFAIAIILFAAAYQNQLGDLAKNAETDIKGFLPWFGAMAAIGAIGLIPKAKPVSNALFGLVFLVLFISNKGIFANITSGAAFKPVSPPPKTPTKGADFKAPAAAPGVQKSGTFSAEAPIPGSGSNGNVIPLPKLGFGSNLLPGVGAILQ